MATYILTSGDDTLTGTAGDDLFYGETAESGGGIDNLDGGAGNDQFLLSEGWTIQGSMNGGDGVDTISSTGGVLIFSHSTTISNVEVLDTSGSRMTIEQISSFSTITDTRASGGHIIFHIGGAGGTLDFSTRIVPGKGVVVLYDTYLGRQLTSGYNITGTSVSDSLYGSEYNDVLIGGGGNDHFGSLSNHGIDLFYGGAGDDTFALDNSSGNFYGDEGNDVFLIDNMYSNVSANVYGGSGVDTVSGRAKIVGITFHDVEIFDIDAPFTIASATLSQLNSFEVITDSNSSQSRIEIGLAELGGTLDFSTKVDGEHSIGVYGHYVTSALNLTGTRFADDLRGSNFADTLDGGQGADVLHGGAGNDIYIVDNNGDTVDEISADRLGIDAGGLDTVRASISFSLVNSTDGFGHVENLTLLGAAAINATGNGLNNTIIGNAAANVLNGGGGADTMAGLGGNDTYDVDNAGDVVAEAAGGGSDLVRASISYVLGAGAQVEYLTTNNAAGTAAINLTGNAFNQTLQGNAGVNVLNGGGGADVLSGLGGNDQYVVDNAGDVVAEGANQGTADRVYALVSYVLGAAAQVEVFTTTNAAGTAAINLTGNAFNQTLQGNAGVNVLNGGGGADAMTGYGGNDQYIVDKAGDVVTEGAGQGTADRIWTSVNYVLGAAAQVEVLTTTNAAGTGAINLIGNAFGQSIHGNAGANILNGGGGTDAMTGYGGNDIFVFNTALGATNVDTITDFSAPADTVWLENAIFTGLAAGALAAGAFASNTTGVATQVDDRIIYNSTTGALLYDADGSGAAASIQFATLTANLAITSADFFVV